MGWFVVDPKSAEGGRIGVPVDVRLTSCGRSQRVSNEGVVLHLSADLLTNPPAAKIYDRARVDLSSHAIASARVNPTAGLGAEVFVGTVARMPLNYVARSPKICSLV